MSLSFGAGPLWETTCHGNPFNLTRRFLEEWVWPHLDFLDRLQIIQHLVRVFPRQLGVEMEGEAVRTMRVDKFRLQRKERFHGVDLTHHGGAKDVDTRAALKQKRHDVVPSHMGGASEARFPVSGSPIHKRVDKQRLAVEQRLGHVNVRMGEDHKVLDHRTAELWLFP